MIFHFAPNGMRLRPLGIFYVHVPPHSGLLVWAVALASYAVYMLPRLAGIAVLPRPWGRLEWFLLGGAAGAVGLTLLLWHPALGQNYFVRTGWAFGAVLSAMGVVSYVERRRVPARVVTAVVAGVVVASLSWSLLLWQAGAAAGHKGWRGLAPIWFAAGAAALVAGLAWLGLRLAARRWAAVSAAGGVAALAVVLGAGLPDLVWDAHLYPNAVNYYHTEVTPDQAAAARWLRAHSSPDDVLATNVHCVQPSYDSCWLMSFRFSAFAERRVLVESWGYASRAVDEAATRSTTPAEIPFWNPDVLVTNEEAFYAPTPSTMDFMRRHGVRWLVVDRAFGWESGELRRFADVRWQHGSVVVYALSQ